MAGYRSFRYVGAKSTAFVIFGLLLGTVGVYLVGQTQGWFEKKLLANTTLRLPNDSALNISKGTEVRIFGNTVGAVEEVYVKDLTQRGAVTFGLKMKIRGMEYLCLVATDSRVLIKEGLTGGAFIQITAATVGAEECESRRQKEAKEITLPEAETTPSTLALVNQVLANFSQDDRPLQIILRNIAAITDKLRTGQDGDLGRLLNRTEVTDAFIRTLEEIRQQTHGLEPILADLRGITQATGKEIAAMEGLVTQLRSTLTHMDNVLLGAHETLSEIERLPASMMAKLEDLPALMLQTQELFRQTTKSMEALQETWLLRGHLEQDKVRRLTPADVVTPADDFAPLFRKR